MDSWTHYLVWPTVLKEAVQLAILVQLLLTIYYIRPLLKLLFLLVLVNVGWLLRMLFGTFLPVHMLNLQRSLLRSLENTDIYTCTGTYIHLQVQIYTYRYIYTCIGTYIHLKYHIYIYRYIYTHVQVHFYIFTGI